MIFPAFPAAALVGKSPADPFVPATEALAAGDDPPTEDPAVVAGLPTAVAVIAFGLATEEIPDTVAGAVPEELAARFALAEPALALAVPVEIGVNIVVVLAVPEVSAAELGVPLAPVDAVAAATVDALETPAPGIPTPVTGVVLDTLPVEGTALPFALVAVFVAFVTAAVIEPVTFPAAPVAIIDELDVAVAESDVVLLEVAPVAATPPTAVAVAPPILVGVGDAGGIAIVAVVADAAPTVGAAPDDVAIPAPAIEPDARLWLALPVVPAGTPDATVVDALPVTLPASAGFGVLGVTTAAGTGLLVVAPVSVTITGATTVVACGTLALPVADALPEKPVTAPEDAVAVVPVLVVGDTTDPPEVPPVTVATLLPVAVPAVLTEPVVIVTVAALLVAATVPAPLLVVVFVAADAGLVEEVDNAVAINEVVLPGALAVTVGDKTAVAVPVEFAVPLAVTVVVVLPVEPIAAPAPRPATTPVAAPDPVAAVKFGPLEVAPSVI